MFDTITTGLSNIDFTVSIQNIVKSISRLPFQIAAALITGAGVVAASVFRYGPRILGSILSNLPNIAVWVATNIIAPMYNAFWAAAITIGNALLTWGPEILGGILSGLGDVMTWVLTNIVGPFLEGIALGVIDVGGAVIGFGDAIFGGILDGLGDIVAWVGTNIIDPIVGALAGLAGLIGNAINEAIPDSINIDIPGVTVLGKTIGGGSINIPLPNPFQEGAHFTGFGPPDALAGVVHAGEAVVPQGGLSVHPSPGGLQLRGAGAGGPTININGNLTLWADNPEQLLDELMSRAGDRG